MPIAVASEFSKFGKLSKLSRTTPLSNSAFYQRLGQFYMLRVSFNISVFTAVILAGLNSTAHAQITGQITGQPAQSPSGDYLPSLGVQPSNIGSGFERFDPGTSALAASNAAYVLGSGDQVSLSVIGYPEFTGTLAIFPDGTVTLPLMGSIRASGLTPNQLSAVLTQQLRTYLVDPVVSVGLVVMRPVVVTVAGEVYRPGPVQLSGLTGNNINPLGASGAVSSITDVQLRDRLALPTLSSAVLLAGGVTRNADIRQISVRRPTAGGQVEVFTLNLWEAITSDTGIADIGLRDGDSVFIPTLSGDEINRRTVASSSLAPQVVRVKVVGEVVRPGEVAVPPNSSISSAVAIAGGPTNDAQLNNVSLVRQDADGQIQQASIDLSNLTDDFQVQEGDVVVVAKKGYLSVIDGIGRVLNPLNIFRLFGL